jgi:hypothetical protein
VKTDELIHLLATNAGPAPRAVAARRLGPAAAIGVLASAAGALELFGPIPAAFYATAAPWLKFAYAGALAAVAAWLTARLGRPVPRARAPGLGVAAVLVAMAVVGTGALVATPAGARTAALLGHSFLVCPINVFVLSLPALAAILWALRGLAPTQLRAAGLGAGLLAGALGAFGYAFTCTELSPAFVAVWYTLGIAVTAGLGAVLGPRVLRW